MPFGLFNSEKRRMIYLFIVYLHKGYLSINIERTMAQPWCSMTTRRAYSLKDFSFLRNLNLYVPPPYLFISFPIQFFFFFFFTLKPSAYRSINLSGSFNCFLFFKKEKVLISYLIESYTRRWIEITS